MCLKGVPQAQVSKDELNPGLDMIGALAAKTGFLGSNGEARRELKQNSISVNKQKVKEDYLISEDDLINQQVCAAATRKEKLFCIGRGLICATFDIAAHLQSESIHCYMKNVGFLFALLFVFNSCSSDDDYVVAAALNGTWVLNRASCFCFFGDNFDFTGHKLTFDSSEQRVIVENMDDTWFIAESGAYTFGNNGGVININGKSYAYEVRGNSLELTFVDNPGIADDEITLFYTKN